MSSLVETTCPYCNSPTHLGGSRQVYGRTRGELLICSKWPECDAFVGVNKVTGHPHGTLANRELRSLRKKAHAAFDPKWKRRGRKGMTRSQAYAWLAKQLGLEPSECHIGLFGVEMCRRVVGVCSEEKREGVLR